VRQKDATITAGCLITAVAGSDPIRANLDKPEWKRLDQRLVCEKGNRNQSADGIFAILSATIGTISTDCLNIKTPLGSFPWQWLSLPELLREGQFFFPYAMEQNKMRSCFSLTWTLILVKYV
jgi:hypothetical protein